MLKLLRGLACIFLTVRFLFRLLHLLSCELDRGLRRTWILWNYRLSANSLKIKFRFACLKSRSYRLSCLWRRLFTGWGTSARFTIAKATYLIDVETSDVTLVVIIRVRSTQCVFPRFVSCLDACDFPYDSLLKDFFYNLIFVCLQHLFQLWVRFHYLDFKIGNFPKLVEISYAKLCQIRCLILVHSFVDSPAVVLCYPSEGFPFWIKAMVHSCSAYNWLSVVFLFAWFRLWFLFPLFKLSFLLYVSKFDTGIFDFRKFLYENWINYSCRALDFLFLVAIKFVFFTRCFLGDINVAISSDRLWSDAAPSNLLRTFNTQLFVAVIRTRRSPGFDPVSPFKLIVYNLLENVLLKLRIHNLFLFLPCTSSINSAKDFRLKLFDFFLLLLKHILCICVGRKRILRLWDV